MQSAKTGEAKISPVFKCAEYGKNLIGESP